MRIVYAAMGNRDTVEGRGGMKILAAFWDKAMAEEVSAIEGGCMGQKQKPWVDEIPVFEDKADREEYASGETRRKALAKLTPADKLILGLEDE
jgi:hypothetical protein